MHGSVPRAACCKVEMQWCRVSAGPGSHTCELKAAIVTAVWREMKQEQVENYKAAHVVSKSRSVVR